MASKQKINLDVKNIGPHKKMNYSENLSKLQIGIYARNGQGKTFISRSFRIFESNEKLEGTSAIDYINNEESNGQFTFGIGNGKIHYEITNKKFEATKNDIDRIFYVFNSDYINENFATKKYLFDGNISGYILGKENIDLTDERKELEDLEKEKKQYRLEIEESIEKIKEDLYEIGISKKQKSFKNIDFDKVHDYECKGSVEYEQVKQKFKSFKSLPEDIDDISTLTFDDFPYSGIDEIKKLMNKEFTLNNFESEFRERVKNNLGFIESGLMLIRESKEYCPFCHQSLKHDALDLIHKYTEYINDEETKINKELSKHIRDFEDYKKAINKLNDEIEKSILKMNGYADYYGCISNESYMALKSNLKGYSDWLYELLNNLDIKRNNITKSFKIEDFNKYENLKNGIKELNECIIKFNKNKNNYSKMQKELKEDLCKEALNKLKCENSDKYKSYEEIEIEILNLNTEIKEKEMKNKKMKKDLVSSDFEKYLKYFFYEKYTFDANSFTLFLNKKQLETSPDRVLSDGEKTIIAFCYYLASIHEKIKDEDDYEKVVLVIDDPISSMDIDYIYQLCSLIKNINNVKNQIKFGKYIIFTHNLDFYNLLIRSKITSKNLYLSNGSLNEYPKELIMPYEFHLKDIHDVAYGMKQPTYTIGNSVRHVLETICEFEGYAKDSNSINDIILKEEEFANDIGLISYIQDMSHGGIRFDRIENDEMIIKACNSVVNYIKHKYPKQIENCKEIN